MYTALVVVGCTAYVAFFAERAGHPKRVMHCFVRVLLSSSTAAKQWKQCKAVQAHKQYVIIGHFVLRFVFVFIVSFCFRFLFAKQAEQSCSSLHF